MQLYLGVLNEQLRFFTASGKLVLTLEEAEQQARQRAESEYQRAGSEHQRAERLSQKLQEMGINPDELNGI